MATIEVKNVAKKYGKKTVLEKLSLTVKDGECFTLLGPSGCGKTVLLRLIAGFEVPDEGTISIGEDLVADGSSRRIIAPNERGLGVVFQDYAVWPHKNVYQNIAYPLELAKVPDVLLILRIKGGGNIIFKVLRELLLTVRAFPTGCTGIMGMAITDPIRGRITEGFHKP